MKTAIKQSFQNVSFLFCSHVIENDSFMSNTHKLDNMILLIKQNESLIIIYSKFMHKLLT